MRERKGVGIVGKEKGKGSTRKKRNGCMRVKRFGYEKKIGKRVGITARREEGERV